MLVSEEMYFLAFVAVSIACEVRSFTGSSLRNLIFSTVHWIVCYVRRTFYGKQLKAVSKACSEIRVN